MTKNASIKLCMCGCITCTFWRHCNCMAIFDQRQHWDDLH